MRHIGAFGLCGLLLILSTATVNAKECRAPTVLMSLPDTYDSAFWGPYADFAQAVAEDLGIKLTVDFSARSDRFDYMERLQSAIAGADKPDYVAAFPYFGAVQLLLNETAAADISVAFLNADLGIGDRKAAGLPRERYKHWVLHSLADDDSAGYDLAEAVATAARMRFDLSEPETVAMAAIGGNQIAASSLQRRHGLEQFVRESGGRVLLNQFVFTDWSYERGREVAVGLFRRHPDTQAVWTANLPLGLAVADAWNAAAPGGIAPAIGTVSGPFDDRALTAIEDGTFSVVVGGHFLEGGIALILLLDHFNGMDFIDDIGTGLRVPLKTVTVGNIASIRAKLGIRDWRSADYAHLSKCLNRDRQRYDFSTDSVLGR